jgi:hypothetical protein
MLDAVIAVITNGDKVLFIQRAPNIRGGGHSAPVREGHKRVKSGVD